MLDLAKFDSTGGLKVPMVKRILPRYIKIITKDLPAKFQISKRIVFDFESGMSTKKMWEEHDRLLQKLYQTQLMIDKNKLSLNELEIPRFSLLDLKIMLAKEILKSCELCEHKCKVNRLKGEKGICKVGDKYLITSEGVHWGEERYFIPSHTIFHWSCNMYCIFCQNFLMSHRIEPGIPVQPKLVAKAIKERSKICRNVNFVGSEPTMFLPWILEVLKCCEVNTPTLWNSNMFMSEKSMKLLDGIIDVYLTDFKFGPGPCSNHLTKVKNYWHIVTRNHLIAVKQGEITIRHLILPNHIDCCTKPALKWIAKNMRTKAIVNIMDQYRPAYKAKEHMDIRRTVNEAEVEEAINYAKKLKLNYVS